MTEPLIEGNHEAADSVSYVMGKVLAAANASLANYGQPAPERQYMSFGTTAWDCEQMTVTTIQAYLGPPGDQAQGPQRCDGQRSGVFQLELLRCIPTGYNAKSKTGPSPESMNEFARGCSRDVWALLEVPNYLGEHLAIADCSVSEPQGAYIAIVLNIVVEL